MRDAQQLLRVAEVADHLRVSTMTVYRLIRRGEIRALRIGRNYRIERAAFEEYLQGGATAVDETAEVS